MEEKSRPNFSQQDAKTSQETGRIFQEPAETCPAGGEITPTGAPFERSQGHAFEKIVEVDLITSPLLSPMLALRHELRTVGRRRAVAREESNPLQSLWTRSVRLSTLELLEAELTNQKLVHLPSPDSVSLHQIAAYEASVYRWQVRRYGLSAETLSFRISIPKYVDYIAKELERLREEDGTADRSELATRTLRWRAIFPHVESINWAVKLVNNWAELLTQWEDKHVTRYDRAHGLLIANLLHERPEHRQSIELPTDNQTLLKKLKSAAKPGLER